MLNWLKKLGVAGYASILGAVFSLVAMIIYIVNSTTGYLAGSSVNALPIIFAILAILLFVVKVALPEKLQNHWLDSFILLAAVVLLSVSICVFVDARTDVAGNQWFIPGMATDAQGACLSVAIAGVVFYVLAVVAAIVAGFCGTKKKA